MFDSQLVLHCSTSALCNPFVGMVKERKTLDFSVSGLGCWILLPQRYYK